MMHPIATNPLTQPRRTSKALLTALSALLLLLPLTACGPSGGSSEPAATESAAPEQPTGEDSDEGAVAYEPAYPEDVSDEGLTEDDTAQQETAHTHADGSTHSHAEDEEAGHEHGDHEHGEGEDHGHEH